LPAPGLPFVTSHLTPPGITSALTQALIDYPQTPEGKVGFLRLGLKAIAPVEAAAYVVMRHHAGDC